MIGSLKNKENILKLRGGKESIAGGRQPSRNKEELGICGEEPSLTETTDFQWQAAVRRWELQAGPRGEV